MARPTIDEILGPGGVLAGSDAGFERRDGQLALARAVAEVLEDGGFLLAEAGTGTGKTLAYLAAAVATGRRVVVSTATRTLQDQIVRKDAPRLLDALGPVFVPAVLKGRQNYLCVLRLEEALASPLAAPGLHEVRDWAARTTSGDRAELTALPEDHPLWDRLTTTSDTCLGGRCPLYGRCWVTRARAAAEAADVIVVNHHLYFGDAAVRAAGGELLPGHDAVIFDEAHALPDIAAQFFGRQVSSTRLAGFHQDLRRALEAAPSGLEGRASAIDALHASASAAERLFALLRSMPGQESGRQPWSEADCSDEAQRRHHDLDSALLLAETSLGEAAQVAASPHAETLALLRQRATVLRDDLALLLEPRTADWVFFREVRGTYVALSGQPVEPAEPLRRHVLDHVPSVVFTSATLTVGGSFDYLRRRLGLALEPGESTLRDGRPVVCAEYPSPFDYATQARLYLPAGLPTPDAPEFPEVLEAQIRDLTALTRGRAFVLFTSHRALDQMHGRLRRDFPFPLLRQGEGPRTALVERFRETSGAVLLGTSTFWEGVDVAGEALSLVIIDKLPFEPPKDPVLVARMEQCRAEGGNPFADLQVPTAALTLKQGFGRLIRTATDRGIVAILDARLTARGYGRRLLASLPPAPVLTDRAALAAWWEAPTA